LNAPLKKPRPPKVHLRTYESGNQVWQINYVDPFTGKRCQASFSGRKDDALDFAHKLYREIVDKFNGIEQTALTEATYTEVIEAFILDKQNRIRPSSIKRYRIYTDNFKAFMAQRFPRIQQIVDIRKVYFEEFLRHLQNSGQEVGTINSTLRVLKSVFIYAVKERYLRENPISTVERFKDEKRAEERRFWTEKELQVIFGAVNAYWRPIYEFIYLTGLREGELINLTWDAVDLNSARPRIKIQAMGDWVPKTGERREVFLNNRAAEIILARHETRAENKYVFTAQMGGKIKEKTIYDNLAYPLRKLHAQGKVSFLGSVHTLRHTFASHLAMRGVSPHALMKLLGHSSIETTMIYAHLDPRYLEGVVDLLNEVEPETKT